MEKDDKLEKYEEQKKELDGMGHQIMNLKQKLDNFRGVEAELDDLNSKMANFIIKESWIMKEILLNKINS